jgi:hypothetical protein
MALLGFERGASTLGQQAQFERELGILIAVARANGAARDPLLRQRIVRHAGLRALRFNALRVLASDASQAQPPAAFIAKYAWSNWHRDFGRLAPTCWARSPTSPMVTCKASACRACGWPAGPTQSMPARMKSSST